MEDLCRIEADNQTFFLVTKTINEGKDGFNVTLCDGEQVWRTAVSKEKVQSMSEALDMSVHEYVGQSISALTQKSSHKPSFVYDVQKQDQNLKFSWKKKLGDGVKFQLGSVILMKENDSRQSVIEILSSAVNHIIHQKEEISSLKSENNRLSNERKNAMKLLEKCTTAKDEMEKNLFQKFAAVLNEKKAKIRQIQSQASEYAKDVTYSGQTKKRPRKRSLSESDSTGSRTPSPPPQDLSEDSAEAEGASKVATPLLLDKDEEEPIMEMNPRRRRLRGPKKETPRSKLVLPKVPAVRKTPSSSSEDSLSTPRLRKRATDKPSPDADELMAEMGL